MKKKGTENIESQEKTNAGEQMENASDEAECMSATERFFKRFHVVKILSECGAYKEKGVPVYAIMMFVFNLMFSRMSMYYQIKLGSFGEKFSKNAVYRFLQNRNTNWQRFILRLSLAVIRHLQTLADDGEGRQALIIDDTPLQKCGKAMELVSRYFNHVNMKTELGYRILTLAWTDGVTTVPLLYTILASSDDSLVVGKPRETDGRTLAGRIRKMARTKATELTVMFVKQAFAAGIKARTVLFDSRFAAPQVISGLKKAGATVIARLKTNSKQYYEYDGRMMNIKVLCKSCNKRRGKSQWKLSVVVNLLVKKNGRILERIPVKLVFIPNRARRNEWICILSTDTGMGEAEIIRQYGKRWEIEVLFKCCKTYLKFGKDFHCTSFEAQNAQIAIAFARSIMIALEKRESEDERSFGGMFLMFCQEMEDLSLAKAMIRVMELFREGMKTILGIPEESIAKLEAYVMGNLPGYMSRALARANKIQIMPA